MNDRIVTDPQDELLTEVDQYDNVIGPISRGEAHESPDKIYRIIYVVVKDMADNIFVHKRSETKDLYPNCWDLSVAGHVGYRKEYPMVAITELAQEAGIHATADKLKLVGKILIRHATCSELCCVFEYAMESGDVIHVPDEEISDIKWMSLDEIKKSMHESPSTWYVRPLEVVKQLY